MPTDKPIKPSVVPWGLYELCDSRTEAAAKAKELSKQYPNVVIAANAAFATDSATVTLCRRIEGLYHAPSVSTPFALFLNGKQIDMVDGEPAVEPKGRWHRLVVCLDFVCENDENEENVLAAGESLLAKELLKGRMEFPQVWLDPEGDGAELPKEWTE